MRLDSPARVAFLRKIHLFSGLDDDQIGVIAQDLEEKNCTTGDVIFQEGERDDKFYFIYSGSVGISQKKQPEKVEFLVAGDYFGEENMSNSQVCQTTASAHEETFLLYVTREKFHTLLKQVPKLRTNVEITIASQRLARQMQFKWLEPDEVIYFLARKHQILLWEALTLPVIALIIPVALLVFASTGRDILPGFISSAALVLSVIIFLIIVGVIIWRWVDWGNDYYIVTNERVIWLEKVVGIYDSRQESPLSMVLSVGVQTDQLGRWLDYGDVIIRTFVGKIIFHHVSHPSQAGALVEEHWARAKATSRKMDMEAMKQTIRQKLGLPAQVVTTTEKDDRLITESPYKPSALSLAFSNIFKLRYEIGNTITYRKHWVVLVEQTWQPTVLFVTGLIVLIWRLLDWIRTPATGGVNEPIVSIVAILLIPIFLWWLYQYIDWRNDIFQVTEDQILDIDKTPLGREERKAAPLDNILATESQRIGFFRVLWNYGDVLITVGSAHMTFEDVRDPTSVQQDIDRRRLARLERKKQQEAAAERERVADWFVSYHRSTEEMRKDQDTRQEQAQNEDEK
jgi:hypothetical protein